MIVVVLVLHNVVVIVVVDIIVVDIIVVDIIVVFVVLAVVIVIEIRSFFVERLSAGSPVIHTHKTYICILTYMPVYVHAHRQVCMYMYMTAYMSVYVHVCISHHVCLLGLFIDFLPPLPAL